MADTESFRCAGCQNKAASTALTACILQSRVPAEALGSSQDRLQIAAPKGDVVARVGDQQPSTELHWRRAIDSSGDPRNIIKSIAAIPGTYSNSILVTVNDIDFDIVARNAIMLLIVLTEPDKEEAVDCMLHLWYSSNIQQKHLELLEAKIRPLVEDVILKIADKAAGSLQRKTWILGNNTFRLTLVKEQWSILLRYLEVPVGVTEPVARHVRTAVTMARRDYIDRSYLAQLPSHRVCMERFRANGILLPFGESTEAFKVPNPSVTPALASFARR
ncbi:hypothetical protein LTR02_013151 [Friedmanniomyces endolithicus]|nr:hypothetical protein LTR03_008096 [Friedmanniomyces endolithicus]KAK0892887.1 hypothetical protein LTR02_013151 [Friedmanniomyces endolithicus]